MTWLICYLFHAKALNSVMQRKLSTFHACMGIFYIDCQQEQVKINRLLAQCFLDRHSVIYFLYLSLVTRKPVFWVCDHVRLKQVCSAKETSYSLEILAVASIGIVLSETRITKVLIRLCGWAGWSVVCAFVVPICQKQVFS